MFFATDGITWSTTEEQGTSIYADRLGALEISVQVCPYAFLEKRRSETR